MGGIYGSRHKNVWASALDGQKGWLYSLLWKRFPPVNMQGAAESPSPVSACCPDLKPYFCRVPNTVPVEFRNILPFSLTLQRVPSSSLLLLPTAWCQGTLISFTNLRAVYLDFTSFLLFTASFPTFPHYSCTSHILFQTPGVYEPSPFLDGFTG